MQLVEYDSENDEVVLKVDGSSFNRLADCMGGVCSYPNLDLTILGLDEETAKKLCDELYTVLREINSQLSKKYGKS